MNVLHEILTWSENLPNWQSDAIRRLFLKHTLDSSDIEDLYALLKAKNGIPNSDTKIAEKITEDQISTPPCNRTHVELLGIKNLINVNAIANNQKLSFGATGLTLIYGDNGSGKSGYSRVLKKACRARDQDEPILPNATQPHQSGKTEATFEIKVNNVPREERWIDGIPAHEDLSAISIFDHRCARAYIDDEDDFSYVPYGFDIFKGLANVCDQIKTRIEKDLLECAIDTTQFDDLRGSTVVGHFIENLTSATTTQEVEKIASLKPDENLRYELLKQSLNTENPREKARSLHIASQRISGVLKNIKEKISYVDELVLTRFSKLDHEFLVAKTAADLAVNRFTEEGNLLPGTGSDTWRELFEAARKFSEEAYPGKSFPNVGNGAKCLLCQQSLIDGASRLARFEEFVQQETEIKVRTVQTALDSARETFSEHDLSLGLDDVTIEEIRYHNEKIAEDCKNFEKELTARYKSMLDSFSSHLWIDIPIITINPIPNLEALVKKIDDEVEILEISTQAINRVSLENERDEFDAKNRLSPRKGAILKFIENTRRKELLQQCLVDVKTNAISLKASEVATRVITSDLAHALNTEFRNLGVANLNVILKSRSEKGEPLYKLVLDLPYSDHPSNILSEGEQRAVAISSFLAEINLNGGTCGIIFDDPVSSLDHRRRERVARRLAIEATRRQVIVFTHDVYFLCVLNEEASRAGVPILTESLVKSPDGFGVPVSGNPFEGMSTKERIKFLRDQQREIAAIFKAGDMPEHQRRTIDAYQRLRDTWERAVEEVLFRNVVLRFRKGIETQRLSEVRVEDSDYATVDLGMSKCSNYTHDKASTGGVAVPDPDELLDDINTLEDWRSSIEKRSPEVRKNRKK